MRRLLAVFLWVVATAGVTYVAGAAVTLVDLQVFPQGERVEVLARPAPAPTTTVLPTSSDASRAVATTLPASTTVPTTTTTGPATASTVPETPSTVPATTTTGPVPTVPSTVAPTTSEPAPTTSAEAGGQPVTTTVPPPTTTTRPVPPLVVAVAALPAATVGGSFEVALSASGGRRPHVWSLAGGGLPAGVALSSGGRLSGSPLVSGQFPFSVRVGDGAGQVATASYVVAVADALRVATRSLPEAESASAYRADLQASGGTPPYRWEVAGGRLPDGLSLSAGGVVSGTPVGGSPATVVVAVIDSVGREARSGDLTLAFVADRRTVAARGGTVFVDVLGDSVSLFLASPADGFSAVVVEPGGFRVEVQFVPLQGDATSWVVCEVADGVVCSHG